ncbi:hypothetical protein BRARA_F02374 [Brassica rapa]|uniref:Uncharacterized protein n=1 Tax=Brassica campestris TaxID=3711 RepID=A0A397Z0M1_BRACM|nr:hypothetical protein BRARA_F02374 [Brassica rapa]
MVMSAAKREKDFLSKSRDVSSERFMKNQAATLIQHKSSHLGWFVSSDRIKNEVSQSKPGLSTDVLASVFGVS